MKNKIWHKEKIIETTISNLEKNNMLGIHVKTIDQLHIKIKELLKEGSLVSVGGSMTLFETGVIDLLRKEDYNFLDRYKEGLSANDIRDIYRQSFSCDAYFASLNALTINGEIYNVDGRGNRVAAMLYGPEKVILICGYNKIVKDIEAAIARNRNICAPINAKRLNKNTPCAVTGYCTDCNSLDRICNEYTIIRKQYEKGRIIVMILDDDYGY